MKGSVGYLSHPSFTLLVSYGSTGWQLAYLLAKEATLERADFNHQLLMFVTAEKEGKLVTILFISIFWSAVVPAVLS